MAVKAAYQRMESRKSRRRPIRSAVAPDDEAADERAGERRRGDPALPAAREAPFRGEHREDEPDEQDLHRDEAPGDAGDEDGAPVEA